MLWFRDATRVKSKYRCGSFAPLTYKQTYLTGLVTNGNTFQYYSIKISSEIIIKLDRSYLLVVGFFCRVRLGCNPLLLDILPPSSKVLCEFVWNCLKLTGNKSHS